MAYIVSFAVQNLLANVIHTSFSFTISNLGRHYFNITVYAIIEYYRGNWVLPRERGPWSIICGLRRPWKSILLCSLVRVSAATFKNTILDAEYRYERKDPDNAACMHFTDIDLRCTAWPKSHFSHGKAPLCITWFLRNHTHLFSDWNVSHENTHKRNGYTFKGDNSDIKCLHPFSLGTTLKNQNIVVQEQIYSFQSGCYFWKDSNTRNS